MTMEQNLKKSEARALVATVVSTVSILCAIFFGGLKMKDAIVEDIRAEFRAEIKTQLNDYKKDQELRDRLQDVRIDNLVNQNINPIK